jgi:hypothetical protein
MVDVWMFGYLIDTKREPVVAMLYRFRYCRSIGWYCGRVDGVEL